MANQSSARIKGDDFQHLLTWHHVLSLKKPNYQVEEVIVEDPFGGLVDDVTIISKTAINFYQIKYHVDLREQYSLDILLDSSQGTSLMQKFWDTWKKVSKTYSGRNIILNLYSHWLINPNDKILALINNENGALSDSFFSSTTRSTIGKEREKWRNKLSASQTDFEQFVKTLRFHLGKDCSKEFKERVSERMEGLSLKYDEPALLVAVGIVRNWVKSGTQTITLAVLEKALKDNSLYLDKQEEKGVSVYLVTVKEHNFDVEPDYIIDWRKHFTQALGKGSHNLINPNDWNKKMLPELVSFEEKINKETKCHLIKARGFARLSAWFAFGYIFSEVSGYTIEINQQDKLWRTDDKPNTDFLMEVEDELTFNKDSKTVAVGISITGSLTSDVKLFLSKNNDVSSLLLLRPNSGISKDCFKSASDVIAFTAQAKEKIRGFVKRNNADRLLLFYFGPLSGACFLGHSFNAVCKEIQIMENVDEGYSPSFILK